MKKMCLLLLTVAFAATYTFAQEKTKPTGFHDQPYSMRNSGSFGKRALILTFTYGFPNSLHAEIYGVQDPNRKVWGPVKVQYEVAVADEVGISARFLTASGEWHHTDSWLGYTKMRTSAWAFGVSGNYHFNKLIDAEKVDLFAGLGVYVGNQTFEFDVDDPSQTEKELIFTPTITVGGRYYFSNVFGIYTEFGLAGASIIDMGLTFRFR